jgi:hypothetical protein
LTRQVIARQIACPSRNQLTKDCRKKGFAAAYISYIGLNNISAESGKLTTVIFTHMTLLQESSQSPPEDEWIFSQE